MKSIQPLIEPKKQPVVMSRQEQREARALVLAKQFLSNLLTTKYFDGPFNEGNSLRRQALLNDEFQYFTLSCRAFRGPIGRASVQHIADFLERFLRYQLNNKRVLSPFETNNLITEYQGADQ